MYGRGKTFEHAQDVKDKRMAQTEDKKKTPRQASGTERKDNGSKVKALQAEIAELKASLSKEKDDYLRLMAEFETFRRRSAEERLELVKSASSDTIKGMLTTLDECERALSILQTSSDEAAKEGTSLIYNKLMDYLKSRGLEVIEAKGKKFDTDFHEAVTQFPVQDESQKGMVIDVVQTGYMLSGKVIRYAKVVVGA